MIHKAKRDLRLYERLVAEWQICSQLLCSVLFHLSTPNFRGEWR